MFAHFYISHTCSLFHRKPNAPSRRTRTHSKPLEADQPPAENKNSEEQEEDVSLTNPA